jgi:integral membrane protein
MSLELRSNPIDRLRLASLLDGVSYLVLLGIAMPLKYALGMPMAVRIVGMTHGILFVALCWFLLAVWLDRRLSFKWCAFVFVCALVPFAPFFLDRKLRAFRS